MIERMSENVPRGQDGIAPPGWPHGVRPPGVDGWEETAVAWLWDLCPAEYRRHEVLQRHPVLLARLARQHAIAALAAARRGYGTARTEVGPRLGPQVVDGLLRMYEHEGGRAAAVEREVELVEAALAGRRWNPRL